MGAFVDYEFRRGFLLDEERIRKIREIIVSRIQNLGSGYKPVYKVYRADNFTYATEDAQQVLNEDNALWNGIVRLIISVKADDDLSLELDFDKHLTSLHIEGEDRDLVYLLFSELRQYLSNEVNTRRSIAKTFLIIGSIVVLSMAIGAGWWLSVQLDRFSDVPTTMGPEAVLAGQNVLEKLNFLIERQVRLGDKAFTRLMLPAFVLLFLSMLGLVVLRFADEKSVARLIDRLFPSDIFLLGKEIDRNKRRQSLQHNVLWGIIISFVVGVLGGFVVWMVTK